MNSLTVPLFLFGHAGAIRRVASSPMAVPAGILFVLSAGVARNYDQVWFGESLTWLVVPLLFSLMSGLWVFLFVRHAWRGRPAVEGEAPARFGRRYLTSYFGLFWMTAPIAWLYAIPVERWYDPVPAAQWNIRLLTVVALWRVLLMGRVVSVIGEMSFIHALGKVLLPAALEALGVTFFAGFGMRVMAGMGGLRNSPAEDVMIRAFSAAGGLALIAAIVGIVLQFICRKQVMRTEPWRPDPAIRPWQAPYALLVLASALWWWISIKPQREQRLNFEAAQLARGENWAGLVKFLSEHRREEFAPSIVLPPSPWEFPSGRHISGLFEHITPTSPVWIRDLYFGYLEALLVQEEFIRYYSQPDEIKSLFRSVDKLEGGTELLRRCATKLKHSRSASYPKEEPGDSLYELFQRADP